MSEIRYFQNHLPSKGHTAIYKIHKYFARRPHNQFRAVIEHYVPESGVILDCFAGGGVTLIEGLTANRRVISVDINPIASLVQQAQVLEIPASTINTITSRFAEIAHDKIGFWFSTLCRHCNAETACRWIERAYVVNCPICSEHTLLDEHSKHIQADGRKRNGTYDCKHCQSSFKSVSVIRHSSEILNIRYKCISCSIEESAPPIDYDINLDSRIRLEEPIFISQFGLTIPKEEIPLEWDRQSEDALRRKGFRTFADLFTVRNRIFVAFMLRELETARPELTQDEYLACLTQISALIRYVNSMTFSTSSWMDGRPVAWAKHAYWTPNQFIEVNPFEYLSNRHLATIKWESDRVARFKDKYGSSNPVDVINKVADYSIICGDSRKLEVPDESIDAVITDPPFGGNVQYGELTHLWQVWLKDSNPFEKQLFDLDSEILVHRKKKTNGKSAKYYETGLRGVFDECYRVLKKNGVLCFTFNNKSADAWYSVMKAAFDAGFVLENEGVHYHEEITAYRDTAHLRYDGELQGDVLYTFIKKSRRTTKLPDEDQNLWLCKYLETATWNSDFKEQAIDLHLAVVRKSASLIAAGKAYDEVREWLSLLLLISKSNRSGTSVLETCKEIILVE
jgi:DNA modification methylase